MGYRNERDTLEGRIAECRAELGEIEIANETLRSRLGGRFRFLYHLPSVVIVVLAAVLCYRELAARSEQSRARDQLESELSGETHALVNQIIGVEKENERLAASPAPTPKNGLALASLFDVAQKQDCEHDSESWTIVRAAACALRADVLADRARGNQTADGRALVDAACKQLREP